MWKPVVGYEGLYEVSDDGRIRSLPRSGTVTYCKLKKARDVRGYIQVALSKNNVRKDYKVHRLVAQAFIPNPHNKKEVNHKDGDKHNNCVDNLEWVTTRENQLHSIYTLGNGKKTKVMQYNKNGRLVKIWSRITEASSELGIDSSSIVHNCNGKRGTAGGFIWKYAMKGEV